MVVKSAVPCQLLVGFGLGLCLALVIFSANDPTIRSSRLALECATAGFGCLRNIGRMTADSGSEFIIATSLSNGFKYFTRRLTV